MPDDWAGRFVVLILIDIVGVVGAVAVPAYHDHPVKARMSAAVLDSQSARDALESNYRTYQRTPASPTAVGIRRNWPMT